MQLFEITYKKSRAYPYLVIRNGETYFEADKFVHAGLCVSVGLLKAYDNNEKVKVVYRGKISKKDKSKIDDLVNELWGRPA